MGGLTPTLKAAQLWPINAKNQVTNWKPFGDSQVETFYHASLEDGRELQKSITDANTWLMEEKKKALVEIQHLFNYAKLGTDGKLDNPFRAIKYGYDIITFMKQVAQFEQNIIKLIGALVKNIGILQTMEANIVAMIQANLNAIASLLHDICNWGLPDVPSIPNMFSDTIWNWNGFNFFPLSTFLPHPVFDVNFAFNQCQIHVPNINILSNFPSSVSSYNGLTYGTPPIVPPLGGIILDTGVNLSDPNFISTMHNQTHVPYFTRDASYTYPITTGLSPVITSEVSGAFNPNTSMQGSLPDPNTIISNYQMPAATYAENILSTIPALLPDVANQNSLTLKKDLAHYITLGAVVESDYEPNLTATWLLYLSGSRAMGGGRAGNWLANFEAAYEQYIQPSIDYLASNDVPWNRVLSSDILTAGPQAIPMSTTLVAAKTYLQGNILWKLSYLEAALLGYTRNTTWDGFADNNFVGTFTGTDLDYATLSIPLTPTTTTILGKTTAEFPVPCTFPSALGANLAIVIAAATNEIFLDTTFQSTRPQYRYVYDQFALATPVDRFSQFWREFNGNLQNLLVQDPYLVGIVAAYPQSLASAIDPLGNSAIYNTITADVMSRNRNWTPGNPLLPFPTVPVVVFTTNTSTTTPASGWSSAVPPPPGAITPPSFNPETFLSRPDIQVLPIPTQLAMLKCNMAAASLMQYQTDITNEISNALTLAQQQAQTASNFGFQVESAEDITIVGPGAGGTVVGFDQIDFDLTGYVTSDTTFTVPPDGGGAYFITGQLNWAAGSPPETGIWTATVLVNGSPIITASTPSETAPITLPFGDTANLNPGDVITILGSHNLSDNQSVIMGSLLNVVMYQPTADTTPNVPSTATSNGITDFIAGATFPFLTAVDAVQSTSPPLAQAVVVPIDPTTVTIANPAISPPFPYTVFPYVDGISLANAIEGALVPVATGYGSVFTVTGQTWTPGGLLYAGPGGLITQDFFDTILPNCSWVVVVGRALSANTFIYEPQIPSQSVQDF